MKKSFPGFYHPTDNELSEAWQSEKTIFVFDTNTLLNLYGYASLTREDFFSILNIISNRIWLPYHVVLEYQKRRLSVVKDEKHIFIKVDEYLKKIEKVFESDFSGLALNRRFPSLNNKTDKLHSEFKKLINNYRKSVSYWDKKQPCVRGHDSIRENLNEIFDQKIGPMPASQEILDNIFKDGADRYKIKTPPGFNDDDKAKEADNVYVYSGLKYERRFGDLIIWKQIIEKAKEENIDSVIFVTDDAKDDWWYIIDSRGKKQIGPRAELREEICREASLNLFTMYTTADFLDNGKKILNVDVSEESISDAENRFTVDISDISNEFKNSINKYIALKENLENIKVSGSGWDSFSEAFNKISNENKMLENVFSNKDYERINRLFDSNSLSNAFSSIKAEDLLKERFLTSLSMSKIQQAFNQLNKNNLKPPPISSEPDYSGDEDK